MEQADRFQKLFEEGCNVVRRDFTCGKKNAALFFNPDLTDAEALRDFIRAAQNGGRSISDIDPSGG